jgi:mannose-1-phosphate guanylyltransferase
MHTTVTTQTTETGLRRRVDEWAVILAGGDGTRLKPLTRRISGDERPKQFCSVLGGRTLLEETQSRVAMELAPERTLHVVNQAHESYYAPLLAAEPIQNLVIQPSNRGTAPAILYSLLRIASANPQAAVAFFPSDHYISDNAKFMGQIRVALDVARHRRNLVLLLGLEPESPEVEYGWIEPGRPISGPAKIFHVRRFWEKPNKMHAQVLQLRGCLWNSFVMVASVQALLEVMEGAIPDLYQSFASLTPLFGDRAETNAIDKLYRNLPEINFSHQVLALKPESLAVLKVTGVRWNDLGEPKRVMASLHMAGVRPHWADAAAPQFA